MVENPLLDVVDKLSRSHTTRVMQANDAGISCISEVEHEPLLVQLRDAVVGGIGRHAGSSEASERLPFDAGARALFDEIAGQVNSWYQSVPGAREERYLEDRLRDWYTDYENRRRAGRVPYEVEAHTLRLLEGWAHRIEGMFEPPSRIELTAPCPLCGERFAHDPRTGDRVSAVLIEFRSIGGGDLSDATGLCRFCDNVWRGGEELKQLRYFVNLAEGHAALITPV